MSANRLLAGWLHRLKLLETSAVEESWVKNQDSYDFKTLLPGSEDLRSEICTTNERRDSGAIFVSDGSLSRHGRVFLIA